MMPCIEWISFAVVTKKGMMTQEIPDNIETEGTGIISSIVNTCDTDVSHQNRTHNLKNS